MADKLTDSERRRIEALLSEGLSVGAAARETGRHKSTVSRVGKAAGIEGNVAATKKANEARGSYAEARRLEIIGKAFDKAEDLLVGIDEAGDLQKWSVAFGTLVDKARLETGEATDRSERRTGPLDLSRMTTEELERFARSLDAPDTPAE